MSYNYTKIRDVAEYITVGFVGSMSKYFVEKGVPLLRGQNIKPYQLDLSNLKFIPPEIHRKWKKSSLQAGDVVLVRVGYPGTATVIPKNLGDINAASLVIVRPKKNELDSYYLCYVINSPWGQAIIKGQLVGAAQQVFNTNDAAELTIPLPKFVTQRKIAAILSAYDDLIENNTRRIKILEEMAQAIYRECFVKDSQDDNSSMISLQDICHQITDGKHGDCQDEENSGYYFISCKDVKEGLINYLDARQIKENDFFETHKRTQLQPDDIVITNSGTIGRMALVPNTEKVRRTTFQKSVAIVKPNKEKVLPNWLFYYLQLNRDTLIEWAGGTAQKTFC